jgi:allantoinase
VASFDLVIRNGTVIAQDGIRPADVFVSDGKIAKVAASGEEFASPSMVIDATGLSVIPGLIDSHVHFRDPGMTHKEDFESGSKGAAAGGTTTVFDMPTTQPVVTNEKLFREKIALVSSRSIVDFGLIAAAGVENTSELERMARAGAIAFKTYTVAPPAERRKEYEGSFVKTPGELLEVMEKTAEIGIPHCIHAEEDSIIDFLTRKLKGEGRMDISAHFESRPSISEEIAVRNAILLAEASGCRVHLLHLSTRGAVEAVREAKRRGVNVTSETCPHYLYFTTKEAMAMGPNAKYNPPARSREDVAALWVGLKDGTIDIVVSDHAPHSRDEKQAGLNDVWKAPPGTPGVETRLPAMIQLAHTWGATLQDVIRLCSTSVAKAFNIYQRKGDLKAGMDADICVIDPNEEWKLDATELQTKAKGTVLYGSMNMRGRVRYTFVRGNLVYERGVGFCPPGTGRFLPGPLHHEGG